jgi:hypothetical protein
VTIGVREAHRICAEVGGTLALWLARPKDPPKVDYGRMADQLQQVVDTLRERSKESP